MGWGCIHVYNYTEKPGDVFAAALAGGDGVLDTVTACCMRLMFCRRI